MKHIVSRKNITPIPASVCIGKILGKISVQDQWKRSASSLDDFPFFLIHIWTSEMFQK